MATAAPDDELSSAGAEAPRSVTEGKATILVPKPAQEGKAKGETQQVFYNPIQQFNRDLSVLAIKTYGEEVIARRRAQAEAKRAKQSRKRKRNEADHEGDNPKVAQDTKPEAATEEPTEQPPSTERGYKPTFKILDALSASGLRALRYAHEIPFVSTVTANDLSASAAESIKGNVVHNGLQDKIEVTNQDALALMYRAIAEDLSHKDRHGNPGSAHKFDVIDLDPYGTAAPFFDAAVQAIRDDGGLLAVTCTDSAIWAGHSYAEKTYALYGGTPLHGGHSHEVGLRLILNAIATSAARYGLAIEPLLSLSIDYYTKLFIKVTRSPAAVKFLGAKTMLSYTCDTGCGAFTVQHLMHSKPTLNKSGKGMYYKHIMSQGPTADSNCVYCGSRTRLTGPLYGGPLHSNDFINKLLDQVSKADASTYGTLTRLEGMLRTALEEHLPGPEPPEGLPPKEVEAATIDHHPFYVLPNRLAGALSCVAPPEDLMRGALIHLGYRVSRSHCKPGSIKTDAPFSTIWWIMTEWIRHRAPIKEANIKPTSAAYRILSDAGIIGQKGDKTADESDNKSVDVDMTETPQLPHDSEQPVGDVVPTTKTEEGAEEVQSEAELRKTLVLDDALARLGRQSRNNEGRKLVRYQTNPEKNWGPLTKAKAQ